MVDAARWFWWAGFDGDIECEGRYALGEFPSRETAIAAGRAEMPDIDGNVFFHIIEAQCGQQEIEGDDLIPFAATRNHEIIDAEAAT